ncbi:MAG: hypothetical protein NWF07_16295 [Candidatus Bathyarchaeota archaeon]|nr:hypothetical protein [Candidatus Bathyarchaeota archaeon]
MQFSEMDSKERSVLYASLFLVLVVFGSAAYLYLNPPVQVFEAKVFEVYEQNGNTFILSYGEGKLKLNGIHEIEVDETYRITYQSRKRNFADVIISIEKIS